MTKVEIAYHFNSGYPGLGNPHGPPIERLVFQRMLAERRCPLATKVYIGDFPSHLLSPDEETFQRAANLWRIQALNGWRRFTKRMRNLTETDIFVILTLPWTFQFLGEILGRRRVDFRVESGAVCYYPFGTQRRNAFRSWPTTQSSLARI